MSQPRTMDSAEAYAARTFNMHSGTATTAEDLMWNGDVAAAEAACAADAKRLPRIALTLAEAVIFRTTVSGSNDELSYTLQLLKSAEKLAVGFADHHPARAKKEGLLPENAPQEVADALLLEFQTIKADATFLSVFINMRAGNRMKAVWRMRKAWKQYSSLLDKVKAAGERKPGSAISAAYEGIAFGAGSFLFLLSMTPDVVLKLLEFVGFEANKEAGLQFLRDSFYGGGVRSALSGLVLLLNLLVMPKVFVDSTASLAEAEEILKVALARWPNSLAYQWLASFKAHKCGDLATSVVHTDKAIAGNGNNDSTTLLMFKATLLISDLRFAEALEILTPLCKQKGNDNYTSVMLLTATCHYSLGHEKEAIEILEKTQTQNNTDKEKALSEMFKRCRTRATKTALVPYEWMLFRREFSTMTKEHAQRVLPSLEATWAAKGTAAKKEEAVLFTFLHALASGATGDKETLERELGETLDAAKAMKKVEPHILPFAEFEMAEIVFKKGDVKGAETLLKACMARSDYVYEDWINTLARAAMDVVKSASSRPAQSV